MEMFPVIALILVLVSLALLSPYLVAPHCPVCSARLRVGEQIRLVPLWQNWRLARRRYYCMQCPYYDLRLVIVPNDCVSDS